MRPNNHALLSVYFLEKQNNGEKIYLYDLLYCLLNNAFKNFKRIFSEQFFLKQCDSYLRQFTTDFNASYTVLRNNNN